MAYDDTFRILAKHVFPLQISDHDKCHLKRNWGIYFQFNLEKYENDQKFLSKACDGSKLQKNMASIDNIIDSINVFIDFSVRCIQTYAPNLRNITLKSLSIFLKNLLVSLIFIASVEVLPKILFLFTRISLLRFKIKKRFIRIIEKNNWV